MTPPDLPIPATAMSRLPDLKEDCGQCAGLCCIAYPFEAHEDFAILKAADAPCPNLSPDFRCSIHNDLSKCGFGGCVAYSCAGAGQRITQDLFEGETWRDDPDLLTHMTYALKVLRPIHEALLILKDAENIQMPTELRSQWQDIFLALTPQDATSIWDFEEPALQEALASVPEFIGQLSPYAK